MRSSKVVTAMLTEGDGGYGYGYGHEYEWFVDITQLFLKLVSIDDGGGGENGKFVEFRTI